MPAYVLLLYLLLVTYYHGSCRLFSRLGGRPVLRAVSRHIGGTVCC